jgi:small GTP-binding protein
LADKQVEIKVRSGVRSRASARNLLSVNNLTKLPANLALIRKFMGLTNWKALHDEVQGELHRKVAIVGMPNTGKSTLFNTLRGQRISAVSPEAGTTKMLIRGDFGPFILIDTPGHLPDVQKSGIDEASVIVLLLDASRGLRSEDQTLAVEVRKTRKPTVVALNKIDALRVDPDDLAGELAARLNVPDVIPISARDGTNVGEELVPALIDANPDAAMAIGVALPAFRRQAAEKVVRTATLVSLAAGLEPIPLIDIPIILGNQIRLVLRIAAVYGEPMTARHARELGTTILGGLAVRYLAEEAAKLVPFGGDVISGAIAAAGTWAIGQVAIEYFENGKRFSRQQIQDLFGRYYRRYREERVERELAAAASEQAALPAPRAGAHTTVPIPPVEVVDSATDGLAPSHVDRTHERAAGE